MSYNLQNIRNQVWYTVYTFPDGSKGNLRADAAKNYMPDALIDQIINESQMLVNQELGEDTQEATTNTVKNSDEMAYPPDWQDIHEIIIYDDYDDDGTKGGTSEHKKGRPLKKVGTYQELIDPLYMEDHGMRLIKSSQSEAGQPTKFMHMERDDEFFVKFDLVCSHAYYIDVVYTTIPATLSQNAHVPEVSTAYQSLIVTKAQKKVATFLKDSEAISLHGGLERIARQEFEVKVKARKRTGIMRPNQQWL